MLRVHLSNAFGTRALHLTSVHIARPIASGDSTIDMASDRALLFDGNPGVIIPPGAQYTSDAIAYPLGALSNLTISMHIEAEPGQQTGHPGSRQTTFYAHGDLTAVRDMPTAKRIDHHGTTTNGNNRWPDALAEQLQENAATREVGVLNQGIGGNHLLTDGLGPNALARFDRDVLAQPGIRYLIVLEGINDLGGLERDGSATQRAHDQLVDRMIGAYRQIIIRAHAHGIRVYGATVTPDGGSDYYHPDAASEHDRQKVNEWIREPGNFDAVIDFDKVMADPAMPQQLLPVFDSGDHLHPGPAGYKTMGQAIPLSLFK
jgi:lysophospholipase L1-like esterase